MKFAKLTELKQELKELYSLLECPSDDGYWPEVQERINQITKQIHDIHQRTAIKKTA